MQRLGVVFARLTQPYQPSPKGSSGRPAHRPFRGLLGVHSRCGPHTRAVTYIVTRYTEGFSHFVTSMTAPVASGWSVWPGGACTHWKAPPCHGAHPLQTVKAGSEPPRLDRRVRGSAARQSGWEREARQTIAFIRALRGLGRGLWQRVARGVSAAPFHRARCEEAQQDGGGEDRRDQVCAR